MGTIYLIIASVVWGVIHSILASHTVKRILRGAAGASAFDKLYRFSYNFFALSSLYPIVLMLYTFPDRLLYAIPSPWSYLMVIVQALALIVLVSTVVQTGFGEFIGWDQLSQIGEAKPPVLITDGWYAYVRHPLYSSLLVFGWLISEMTINRLALLMVFTFYILIGAWFEERKLLKDFNPAYAEYKARVPMLFPKIVNRKS